MKRIMNKISNRLFISVLIVMIILVVLTGLFVSNYMTKTVESELEDRLASESDFSVFQIENLFIDASNYVRQLDRLEIIEKYLFEADDRDFAMNAPEREEIVDIISSMEASSERIFLVWIANEAANFFLDQTGFYSEENYDVHIRPWYKVALSSDGINYTDPYIEWATRELVVSTIKAKTEANGEHAFVAVDFNLSILPEVTSGINVGKKGKVYIINRSGMYVYHDDPSKVMTTTVENDNPELYKWLSRDAQTNELQHVELGGVAYYASVETIDYADWQLVTLVNRKESLEDLKSFMRRMILTLVILGVLVSYFVYWDINKRLSPIDGLTFYSEQIAKGNLDEALPYEYTRLHDEMGNMARSFVTIAEVFRQKNKALEDIVNSQYEEINQQYHYIIEKEKIASLGVLVAGVAHEINTPLGNGVTTSSYIKTLVRRLCELHANNKLSRQEFMRILESLTESSDLLLNNLMRAADLVKQFKSIATNQNLETLKEVNLKDEIENVITSLKPTIKKRQITIENRIDKKIMMTTYPGAISQVFTNFIINSMHHGFNVEDDGHIAIEATQEGELVRLVYSDDGKGIAEDIIEHIFEPFYTTRRNKNNSGLGMYITHNLVNSTLSGMITCESQVGKGTRFILTLPRTLKA